MGNRACKQEAFTSPPAPRRWARSGVWTRQDGARGWWQGWMCGWKDRYFTITHTKRRWMDGRVNYKACEDARKTGRKKQRQRGRENKRAHLFSLAVFIKQRKPPALINHNSFRRVLYIVTRTAGACFVSMSWFVDRLPEMKGCTKNLVPHLISVFVIYICTNSAFKYRIVSLNCKSSITDTQH